MICDVCGAETNINHGNKFHILCSSCDERHETEPGTLPSELSKSVQETKKQNGLLGTFGVVFFLAGLFFLFFNPTSSMSATAGGFEILNFHDMFIGQTLALVGAVFIAAHWRPR